uniref:Elongation factor 1-gamma n=1 Tax=Rhabditophanes sp. KR3021 TaxID=114890 RepID=A0AC35TNJ9_9BILA
MTTGKLYGQKDSFRTKKVLVVAKYAGVELELINEIPQEKFPLGISPAYESGETTLFGSDAIALHIAAQTFPGVACSAVCQWLQYSEGKLVQTMLNYVLPSVSAAKLDAGIVAAAKTEFHSLLSALDKVLLTKTFLAGERISLADISVALTLLPAFEHVLDAGAQAKFQNVTRFFKTIVNQDNVKAVLGEVKYAAKESTFCADEFAKLSVKSQKTAAKAEAKVEKTEAKVEKKKEVKKEAKKESEVPQPMEEPVAEKFVDPFSLMPPGTLVMDNFKRVYSNEDTATKAIPWLWENFDAENYSVWYGEYKYPEDLTLTFMSCNLINGMFQRLDKMRKHAFGSVCLFGTDNASTISGIWIWRGHELAFPLSRDWTVDYESYEWKKLDVTNEADKKTINEYLLWEGDFGGKKFSQGKIFK